jgi:hypothetical protein
MGIRAWLAAGVSAASLFAQTILPATAASDAIRWGKVSGWDILIDPSLGNGCFIFTIYDNGTALRLGFSPDDGEAYLMVGNQKWSSIEHGKDYDIEIRMDRDVPWEATATGVDFDGVPLLLAYTDEPNFLVDFMKKNTLDVRYNGKSIATLSLRGTFAAIGEMLKCQDQVDSFGIGNRGAAGDPFAGSKGGTASDPFKR